MALNLPFGRLTTRLPSRTSTMKCVHFELCRFDLNNNRRLLTCHAGEPTTKRRRPKPTPYPALPSSSGSLAPKAKEKPCEERASQGFFELSPMGRGPHFTSIMARDHATKGSQLSPQGCSGRRTRTRYPRGRSRAAGLTVSENVMKNPWLVPRNCHLTRVALNGG